MLNFPIWEPKWKFLVQKFSGFIFPDYITRKDKLFGDYRQLTVDFSGEDPFDFLDVATFLNN